MIVMFQSLEHPLPLLTDVCVLSEVYTCKCTIFPIYLGTLFPWSRGYSTVFCFFIIKINKVNKNTGLSRQIEFIIGRSQMSETTTLEVNTRHDVGKGASRRLRKAEQIPAVIYGGDEPPLSITVEARIVRRALEIESFYSQVIKLNITGQLHDVILKDVQRHPAKGHALHLDFLRVKASQLITTNIPLHFINKETCIGVKAGGKISYNITEINVRCLPKDIPEFINIDVAQLDIGSTLHLSDLAVPKDIQLVQLLQGESHNLAIVTVSSSTTHKEEEEVSSEETTVENSASDET